MIGHEPRVLVVEDDASIREIIKLALEQEGVPVESAADGAKAIEMAARHMPSLLVLDMGLPIVDGDGVARAVRSIYGDEVPIVVVTANGEARECAKRVGAIGYLRKPFDIDELVDRVRGALALGAVSREQDIRSDMTLSFMPA